MRWPANSRLENGCRESRPSVCTSSTGGVPSMRSTAPGHQVIDIRRRRGVRGSEYCMGRTPAPAAELATMTIGYEHRKPGARPDTELRQLQYREDAREGVGKRSRVHLSPDYIDRNRGDPRSRAARALIRRLPVHGIGALMCVEATAGGVSSLARRPAPGGALRVRGDRPRGRHRGLRRWAGSFD